MIREKPERVSYLITKGQTVSKRFIKLMLRRIGYRLQKIETDYPWPVELDDADISIIKSVKEKGLSMTSVPRLICTLKAVKYAISSGIPGDFVECGVWRGGHALIAADVIRRHQSRKKVFLFDTFEGMTEPTDQDKSFDGREDAAVSFERQVESDGSGWCHASLEDVQQNFYEFGFDGQNIRFVRGDVMQTLKENSNLPAKISVLRLDTDWYKSTYEEMRVLFPRLSQGGSLLIDDYGYWQGSRKAVDQYLSEHDIPLCLFDCDFSGRVGIKVGDRR